MSNATMLARRTVSDSSAVINGSFQIAERAAAAGYSPEIASPPQTPRSAASADKRLAKAAKEVRAVRVALELRNCRDIISSSTPLPTSRGMRQYLMSVFQGVARKPCEASRWRPQACGRACVAGSCASRISTVVVRRLAGGGSSSRPGLAAGEDHLARRHAPACCSGGASGWDCASGICPHCPCQGRLWYICRCGVTSCCFSAAMQGNLACKLWRRNEIGVCDILC